MNKTSNLAKNGLSMRWIQFLTLTLVLILSVLIVLVSWRVVKDYDQLRSDTDDYISRQQDANNMMAASDYLTIQARDFTYTGDRQYRYGILIS